MLRNHLKAMPFSQQKAVFQNAFIAFYYKVLEAEQPQDIEMLEDARKKIEEIRETQRNEKINLINR